MPWPFSTFGQSFYDVYGIHEERSGSVGRVLDKWLLVRVSPPVKSLSCVLEQDTLFDA